MNETQTKEGFILSDTLLGLLIVCVSTLTFAQAQSMVVKISADRYRQVEVLRQRVEQAWLKRPEKVKKERPKKRPPTKNQKNGQQVEKPNGSVDSENQLSPLTDSKEGDGDA